MRWPMIVLLILICLLVVCVIIKLILRRRLREIDGWNGTRVEDHTRDEGTVIGVFGDDDYQ